MAASPRCSTRSRRLTVCATNASLTTVDAFLNYQVPELDETFSADGQSLLDLQPPPAFSKTGLPMAYL